MIPNFRDKFKSDLSRNFEKLSRSYTKNIYLPDIELETIMYAADICLEFKDKAGFISQEIILEITNQVCDVISDFFDVYTEDHRRIACVSVVQNMALPNVKKIVRDYYTLNY